MSAFKVTYFVNQYPKVSHSFIRREILALERQGFAVQRIALRGWNGDAVDAEDLEEREKTRYVLQDGIFGLLKSTLKIIFTRPIAFLRALKLALQLSVRADRPWPFHLVYLAEACRMLPWIEGFGASHVHAHFGTNSTEVVMLARFLGGPEYSFTVHGPEEFDKPQSIKLKEKVRHAAFVVAISSFGRSQLYRWIDFADWDKVKLVHCGLEKSFHEQHGSPIPSAPRLVCVGRLCEQKGQLLLVHAVSRLLLSGIDVQLVLAGDGEMRGEIEALLRQSSLREHVYITGWISSAQVREQILAARALVLPSFAEGLPVVIMEAMALHRPVLSTYVAGIPELVRPGEGGWLFPAGDVDALEHALKQVLSFPPEDLERMGAAAHLRVMQNHSIDTEVARLSAYFMKKLPPDVGFADHV